MRMLLLLLLLQPQVALHCCLHVFFLVGTSLTEVDLKDADSGSFQCLPLQGWLWATLVAATVCFSCCLHTVPISFPLFRLKNQPDV